MSEIEKLTELLKTFNVPAMRRDLNEVKNILWLGRNLPINNINNPNLNEAMSLVNKLGREVIKKFID